MSQHKDWDVVVVGGINTDYLVHGKKLPAPGQTLEGEVFYQGPGGKGANQAVAAARLGARVAIIGRVGAGKRGQAMIDNLRKEGVNTDHILRDEHVETGAAVIMLDQSGEKQIFAAPGTNAKVTVYDVLKAEGKIRAARVVLAQLEVPIAAVEEALRIGRANGAKTVLDPAPPRTMGNRILRDIDLIRPNSHEASFLTGINVKDPASARLAAEFFLEKGVGSVVIGAGDAGDLLVWRDGELLLPRIPVESVDATGAGDAFAGALAVGLARQQPLVVAAPFASAAAALATTKIGAQTGLPRQDEVQKLLSKMAA